MSKRKITIIISAAALAMIITVISLVSCMNRNAQTSGVSEDTSDSTSETVTESVTESASETSGTDQTTTQATSSTTEKTSESDETTEETTSSEETTTAVDETEATTTSETQNETTSSESTTEVTTTTTETTIKTTTEEITTTETTTEETTTTEAPAETTPEVGYAIVKVKVTTSVYNDDETTDTHNEVDYFEVEGWTSNYHSTTPSDYHYSGREIGDQINDKYGVDNVQGYSAKTVEVVSFTN